MTYKIRVHHIEPPGLVLFKVCGLPGKGVLSIQSLKRKWGKHLSNAQLRRLAAFEAGRPSAKHFLW